MARVASRTLIWLVGLLLLVGLLQAPEGAQAQAGKAVSAKKLELIRDRMERGQALFVAGDFAGGFIALLARKLLMNIAVQHGAAAGRTFAEYVDHLAANGFVPPNGKPWVDQLRTKGNEATHEIHQTSQADARQVLTFAEMLLRFVYEFPSMVGPTGKP